MEVITRPQLIEAYLRIRVTKDDTFIQVYAQMDEQYKEERRKEKRRLQDQLRRIKRNEQKVKSGVEKTMPEKKPPVIKPNLLKMRSVMQRAHISSPVSQVFSLVLFAKLNFLG